MKRPPTIPSHVSPNLAERLIIRMAVPADALALERLAQLDSALPPEPVPTLVRRALLRDTPPSEEEPAAAAEPATSIAE